jgi:hypothetical protein
VASAASWVGVIPASSCRRSRRDTRAIATRSRVTSISGALTPSVALDSGTSEAYVGASRHRAVLLRADAAEALEGGAERDGAALLTVAYRVS